MDAKTRRLHIRDIVKEDLDSMTLLWMNPAVKHWMGTWGPQTANEVLPWIEETIAHNQATPRLAHNCAIVESESELVAGWIGFGPASKPGIGDLDFGYAMLEQFRNRGYATEALLAVIEFCFDVVGVSSFFGNTLPDNAASARVMDKVGMKRVGLREDGEIIFRIERSPSRTALNEANSGPA
jgi:ribosomal-protein-alanine N-acetyltransferase